MAAFRLICPERRWARAIAFGSAE